MAARKAQQKYPDDDVYPLNVDLNNPPIDPRIDKIVTDLINPEGRSRFPGVALLVRSNEQIVHLNCYGYANLETGAKIKFDTIFDLGSLSKQFTAAAVLDLAIIKKLSLKDPLSKFFNGFPRYADTITVEDLIHHTAGLPEYTDLYVASRRGEKDWYHRAMRKPDSWYPRMKTRRKKEVTNRDVLDWIATQTLLPHPPDTEFEYCNSGYVVLAELVAHVAKRKLGDFLAEILFDEIGMKNTYVFDHDFRFAPRSPQVVNHAKCYNRVGRRYVPVGYTPLNFISGDGNIHTTILDMAKWERNLHELEFSPVSELFWKPIEVKSHEKQSYGAGWNLIADSHMGPLFQNGKRVTGKIERRAEHHRGIWLGWRSFFARASRWPAPQAGKRIDRRTVESLGIVVLSNAVFDQEKFTTCHIVQEISRLYWPTNNVMNKFVCES